MNVLLFEPTDVVGGVATIDGRRARHLIDVLGVTPGRRLRAGVVGGPLGEAEVVAVAGGAVTLRFAVPVGAVAPAHAAVDLVVAVPRPKVLTRLLEHAAAGAVRRIDLVNAWRVDKSYLGSSRLAADEAGAALRRGAEQGMTTHLPALTVHARLMTYLDDVLPAVTPAGAARALAHARGDGDVGLEQALAPGEVRPIVVAIGPEGGWIEREVDSFFARGFTVVSLGAAVLRVEAAVTAALAQVALLRRLPRPGSAGA